jgi:tRNA pseudouridine38-40 synthase
VAAPERRWRLDVAYRGSGFHGFAAQPGAETVAGALSDALATALRLPAPPALGCAGRTDSGVHALGQVVHVDLPDPLFEPSAGDGADAARLARSLDALLGGRVVVHALTPAPSGFDARRSATSRTYRYLVHDAPSPSPLLCGLAWHVTGPLDVRAMAQAGYTLLGEHDFRAFCRRPSGTGPDEPVRRRVLDLAVGVVDDALGVAPDGRLVRVEVTASSFCHQMVRSVTAALVAVGTHALSAADLTERLRVPSRAGLPAPAPPEGLCLVAVGYA